MGKQLPGMQAPMFGSVTPGQPTQRGAFGSLRGGGQQQPMQQPMIGPGGGGNPASFLDFYNRQVSPEQRARNEAGMADGSYAAYYQQATGQPLPQQPQQAAQAPTFAPNDPRYAFGPGGQQLPTQTGAQQLQQQQQMPAAGTLQQAPPGMLGFFPGTTDAQRQQFMQQYMQQQYSQQQQTPQQQQMGQQAPAASLGNINQVRTPAPQQPAFNPTQAISQFGADLGRRVKAGTMTLEQARAARNQFRDQVQLNTQTPQTRQGAEGIARNIMQQLLPPPPLGIGDGGAPMNPQSPQYAQAMQQFNELQGRQFQPLVAPPPSPGFNMGGEAMEDPRMQAMRYIQQLANQQRGY